MRAFLYARVSTGDQNEGMQVREMLDRAHKLPGELHIEQFIDAGFSGASARRPELDRMLALARRGKCDVVIVYRFDRFARSTRQLVNALEEFQALGVQFISVHESIDTTTPMGKFAFTVFAAIAEFERELIRERVRSGMAHAKAQGKRVGRPAAKLNAAEIAALRAQGLTWREVSSRLGAGVSTCKRILAAGRIRSAGTGSVAVKGR